MSASTRTPMVSLSLAGSLLALAMASANCGSNSPATGSTSTGGGTGQASGGAGAGGSIKGTGGTGGANSGTGGIAGAGSGGSTAIGGITGGSSTVLPDAAVVADTAPPAVDTASVSPPSNLRWPKCVPIFDGKTTAGWGGMDGFKITADGVMAGLGKGGQNYTVKDYKDFRWIFSLRNIPGSEHNPSIIMWGHNRQRGLAGIQVQAPTCGGWDYRDGKNRALGPLKCSGGGIDKSKWAQCEFLANSAESKLQMACCQQDAEGTKPCKGVKILEYVDPTAPSLGAVGFMLHNPGIFDEFKDVCMEENPTENVLITTQYTP